MSIIVSKCEESRLLITTNDELSLNIINSLFKLENKII